MYDKDLKYCPVCKDEYLAHIVNCGVCDELLLTGIEMVNLHKQQHGDISKRKGALTPSDDIATVFKGPMQDVKRLEAKLISVNIGTMIVKDGGGCGQGCCAPEVELKIRREDGEAAIKIMETDFDEMTGALDFIHSFDDHGFDPNNADTTCPACGCNFSTQNSACPDCGLCFG